MPNRAGESDKTWFRSERYLCMNGEWFFITREKSQEGPYRSQTEAERDLCVYIRHQNEEWTSVIQEPKTDDPPH